MCMVLPCVFRRADGVSHSPFYAASQHQFVAAVISRNAGNAPRGVHFSRSTILPKSVVEQLGFHQLLPIVTGLKSGCVRLTYRILGQVWHKEGVSSLSVQCSDKSIIALCGTKKRRGLLGAVLHTIRPCRSGGQRKRFQSERDPHGCPPARSLGAARANCGAPTTWGLATGAKLGYSLLRVA